MKRTLAVIAGIILLHSYCPAEEAGPLKDQKAKDSYCLGYDFGANLKRQGVDVDPAVLFAAIRDGIEDRKPSLGPEEIRENLLRIRRKLMVVQDQRFRTFSARNLQAGKAFLDANKSKQGVTVLPSGLQYRVVQEGSGPSPNPSDSVTVHYRGTLIDGEEFDSSYGRGEPATLPLGSVIQGWQEALSLMKTGAKWQIFVPANLAYGQRHSGRIPPNSTLVFEIELLGVGGVAGPGLDESRVREGN